MSMMRLMLLTHTNTNIHVPSMSMDICPTSITGMRISEIIKMKVKNDIRSSRFDWNMNRVSIHKYRVTNNEF
jgi:hypothetical protein